jgi:hypothetical protein
MAAPLLAFAFASEPWRGRVIGLLTDDQRPINAVTGVVLVAISVYYLFVVFTVQSVLL